LQLNGKFNGEYCGTTRDIDNCGTALETTKVPYIFRVLWHTKWLKIGPEILSTLSILLHCQPSYTLQLQATLRWRRTANLNQTALGFFAAQVQCDFR